MAQVYPTAAHSVPFPASRDSLMSSSSSSLPGPPRHSRSSSTRAAAANAAAQSHAHHYGLGRSSLSHHESSSTITSSSSPAIAASSSSTTSSINSSSRPPPPPRFGGPSSYHHHSNPSRSHRQSSLGTSPSLSQSSTLRTIPHSHPQMTSLSNTVEAKVVIVGSQGVGKTSIVHRYISGTFATSLASTIGASFLTKKLVVDNCKVRLQIWDTAGQERFRSMAPIYYRGADVAILVYDITSYESFQDVRLWLDELRRNLKSDLVVHVVGAKADLAPTKRAVTINEAQQTVREWWADIENSYSNNSPRNSLDSSSLHPRNIRLDSSSSSLTYPNHNTNNNHPTPNEASASRLSLNLGFNSRRKSYNEEDNNTDFSTTPPNLDTNAHPSVFVTEVSAKDDYGIEDVFCFVSQRLVERKLLLEDSYLQDQDNIIITDDPSNQSSNPSDAKSSSCC